MDYDDIRQLEEDRQREEHLGFLVASLSKSRLKLERYPVPLGNLALGKLPAARDRVRILVGVLNGEWPVGSSASKACPATQERISFLVDSLHEIPELVLAAMVESYVERAAATEIKQLETQINQFLSEYQTSPAIRFRNSSTGFFDVEERQTRFHVVED